MRHGFEVYIRNGFSELVNAGPLTALDKKMEGGLLFPTHPQRKRTSGKVKTWHSLFASVEII
jgi:hypothetical protein